MLSLTRKSDYALVALADLGYRYMQGEKPASARVIADAYKLPLPLLMNVLKELSSADILTSTRGATGGYKLARDPNEISVHDVIAAIEGPMRVALCAEAEPLAPQCNLESGCPIKAPVRTLHERVAKVFKEMTLADLVAESDLVRSSESCACSQQSCGAVGNSMVEQPSNTASG